MRGLEREERRSKGIDMTLQKNVLGTPLEMCGEDPVTGFYREGDCKTGVEDGGLHGVCAIVTLEDLLAHAQEQGYS